MDPQNPFTGVIVVAGVLLTATFFGAFEVTLQHEGGYVDDPVDLGGETNFGITAETARQHGIEDVAAIVDSAVVAIYFSDYWAPLQLDTIAERDSLLATILFDFGVNAGPGRSGRALQRCLNAANRNGRSWGDIPVDGIIGPRTLSAYQRYSSGSQLLTCVQAVRSYHYLDIIERRPANEKYFYGWFRRATLEP